MFSFFSKCS